ncbi:MAG TPA: nucleoside-diphosphate kinase [Myxococcales bacterium]|nr:nucleoside-diphosphate kinase [Myxococcales bacterium]
MASQRTLSLIKPDGLEKGIVGKIVARFEEKKLKPVAMKLVRLTQAQAEGFYAVHRERPFFKSLCQFMTSGPILAMVLEGENAVARNREIMGATDPKKADAGTIRKDFATDVEKNTVHGSDSPENAAVEIAYFFGQLELQPYDWK